MWYDVTAVCVGVVDVVAYDVAGAVMTWWMRCRW